jgi:serine protease Do
MIRVKALATIGFSLLLSGAMFFVPTLGSAQQPPLPEAPSSNESANPSEVQGETPPQVLPPLPELADNSEKKAEEGSNSESPRAARRSRIRDAERLKKSSSTVMAVFEPVNQIAAKSTVRIMTGNKQIAMGVVVDPNGFILTKASELTGNPECYLADGRKLASSVYGVHGATDLALLKIDASDLSVVQWSDQPDLPPVGSWVVTPSVKQNPVAVGVLSVLPRRVFSGGVLGVQLEMDASKPARIVMVFAESPAEKADIQVNDVILEVNRQGVGNRLEVIQALTKFPPGERIEVKLKRGENELVVRPVLGARTIIDEGSRRSEFQNTMGGQLSRRRTGFEFVFEHDSVLRPEDCGGVIVDLDGRAVGLNIARAGRVSSFALPISVIRPVLEELRTGTLAPQLVNKPRIELIEQELVRISELEKKLPVEKEEASRSVDQLKFQVGYLERALEKAKKEFEEAQAELEKIKTNSKQADQQLRSVKDKLEEIPELREKLEKEKSALEKGFGSSGS